MTLVPYSDKTFSCYQSASAQETRFGIGQQIQASIILSSFVEKLETVKRSCMLISIMESYILLGLRTSISCKLMYIIILNFNRKIYNVM